MFNLFQDKTTIVSASITVPSGTTEETAQEAAKKLLECSTHRERMLLVKLLESPIYKTIAINQAENLFGHLI